MRRDSEELALCTPCRKRGRRRSTPPCAWPSRPGSGSETPDEFDATIDTQVPHPTFSDDEAQARSEFVERLDDDGCQQGLVALAPHGGAIERHTDQQAERVALVARRGRASAWRCKGFKTGGGALERWHITSTEIHEASFPLLKTIASRGFVHAVAFHGFSEADVLVGGAAPLALKRGDRRGD